MLSLLRYCFYAGGVEAAAYLLEQLIYRIQCSARALAERNNSVARGKYAKLVCFKLAAVELIYAALSARFPDYYLVVCGCGVVVNYAVSAPGYLLEISGELLRRLTLGFESLFITDYYIVAVCR